MNLSFNHDYLYNSLRINVASRNNRRLRLEFRDNYERNFGFNSIYRAFTRINRNDVKYFHLRECKNNGLVACLSDKYEDKVISTGRYRQITIPIEGNEDNITDMLIDIMIARTHYSNYRMTKAKINKTNIVLESKKSELIVDNYWTHIVLPNFNEYDKMYQISEDINLKGWYNVTPLSLVHTNENDMRSVIMTRKELEDNIITPLNYKKNHTA